MKDHFFDAQNCDRCGAKLFGRTMSMFNTEVICSSCAKAEKEDPRYHEAVEAERAACKSGNFPGIGRSKAHA